VRTEIVDKVVNHRLYHTRPSRFVREFLELYIREHVPRSAAALSYYITISVFPLLICATAILSSLHITEGDLFAVWREIVPAGAIELLSDFLGYLSGNISKIMVFVGITTMFTSSSAVFRTIMNIMGDLHGAKRFKGVLMAIVSFVASIVFLAVIYASGVVILTGEWFVGFLDAHFALGHLSGAWLWFRYFLLFAMIFVVFYFAYAVTAPRRTREKWRSRHHAGERKVRSAPCLPGALLAAVCIVAVSAAFSILISASTRYAIVYGSLASIIILMTWIYTCALVFILGNIFNIAVMRSREKPSVKLAEASEKESEGVRI